MSDDRRSQHRDAYLQLLDLWKSENPIKTTKLQVLLAVNGALISIVQLNGGLVRENLVLFIAGFLLCLVWTLSIGRTALFQRVWRIKMKGIAKHYPDDPCFNLLDTEEAIRHAPWILRFFGGVSSKYYLLAAPVVFAFGWITGIVFVL